VKNVFQVSAPKSKIKIKIKIKIVFDDIAKRSPQNQVNGEIYIK